MRYKRMLCAFLCLLLTPLFAGCWSSAELETYSVVSGFAIDKGEEGFRYHFTFELFDTSKSEGGAKLLETEGDTVFDGVRNAVAKSQKRLFFSDCKVIVISPELAREGIAPLLDWAIRDNEPWLTINPVISKKKTAREVLQQKPVTDQMLSLEIWRTLDEDSKILSESPKVQLFEAGNLLNGKGCALYLPTIDVTKTSDGTTGELSGTAVFKRDRLVGFLDRRETKFFLYAINGISGGLLLTSPGGGDRKVSLEVFGNRTTIRPVVENGRLTMKIGLNVTAALGEDQTADDYLTDKGIQTVQNSAARALEEGVQSVIRKTQTEFGSDIFGFGAELYHNAPDLWEKFGPSWETTFRTLKCEVSAVVSIENSASAKGKVRA